MSSGRGIKVIAIYIFWRREGESLFDNLASLSCGFIMLFLSYKYERIMNNKVDGIKMGL